MILRGLALVGPPGLHGAKAFGRKAAADAGNAEIPGHDM